MSCSKNCIEPYRDGRSHWRGHHVRGPRYDPLYIQQPVYIPQPAVSSPPTDLTQTLNNPTVIIGYFCCFSLVAILAMLYYKK